MSKDCWREVVAVGEVERRPGPGPGAEVEVEEEEGARAEVGVEPPMGFERMGWVEGRSVVEEDGGREDEVVMGVLESADAEWVDPRDREGVKSTADPTALPGTAPGTPFCSAPPALDGGPPSGWLDAEGGSGWFRCGACCCCSLESSLLFPRDLLFFSLLGEFPISRPTRTR